MKNAIGITKNAFNWMYLSFVFIKSAIGSDKKYIIKEATTDVKDKIVTTCFLKWNILVHFSWEAKEAIKRMEVVSSPNFARRVNNLKTVIAKT